MARKSTVPTHEERIAAAAAKAGAAVSVFHAAAADLVSAAEEQAQLRDEALAQAEALRNEALDREATAEHLDQQHQEHLSAAERIRSLFA